MSGTSELICSQEGLTLGVQLGEKLQKRILSSRIKRIYRIVPRVRILMQCSWISDRPRCRVHGLEPARQLVIIARPQLIQIQIAVEALAAVEVGIRDRSRAGDRAPKASNW